MDLQGCQLLVSFLKSNIEYVRKERQVKLVSYVSYVRQVREEREARNIPGLYQKKATTDTMESTGLSITGGCFEVK